MKFSDLPIHYPCRVGRHVNPIPLPRLHQVGVSQWGDAVWVGGVEAFDSVVAGCRPAPFPGRSQVSGSLSPRPSNEKINHGSSAFFRRNIRFRARTSSSRRRPVDSAASASPSAPVPPPVPEAAPFLALLAAGLAVFPARLAWLVLPALLSLSVIRSLVFPVGLGLALLIGLGLAPLVAFGLAP